MAVAAVVAGVATVTKEFSPGKFEGTAPSRFRRSSWFATTLQSQPLPLLGYVLANACGPSVRFNRSGIDALSLAHVDCRYPCAPVAQLDRAVASGATGREFESLRAHHPP